MNEITLRRFEIDIKHTIGTFNLWIDFENQGYIFSNTLRYIVGKLAMEELKLPKI